MTDLRSAEAFWGLPQVPYSVVKVGAPSADTSGVDEWDLDTQISSGFAQKVKHLYVYDTTSLSDSDIALEFSQWVNPTQGPGRKLLVRRTGNPRVCRRIDDAGR